jgi:hypothetical protein
MIQPQLGHHRRHLLLRCHRNIRALNHERLQYTQSMLYLFLNRIILKFQLRGGVNCRQQLNHTCGLKQHKRKLMYPMAQLLLSLEIHHPKEVINSKNQAIQLVLNR